MDTFLIQLHDSKLTVVNLKQLQIDVASSLQEASTSSKVDLSVPPATNDIKKIRQQIDIINSLLSYTHNFVLSKPKSTDEKLSQDVHKKEK